MAVGGRGIRMLGALVHADGRPTASEAALHALRQDLLRALRVDYRTRR